MCLFINISKLAFDLGQRGGGQLVAVSHLVTGSFV